MLCARGAAKAGRGSARKRSRHLSPWPTRKGSWYYDVETGLIPRIACACGLAHPAHRSAGEGSRAFQACVCAGTSDRGVLCVGAVLVAHCALVPWGPELPHLLHVPSRRVGPGEAYALSPASSTRVQGPRKTWRPNVHLHSRACCMSTGDLKLQAPETYAYLKNSKGMGDPAQDTKRLHQIRVRSRTSLHDPDRLFSSYASPPNPPPTRAPVSVLSLSLRSRWSASATRSRSRSFAFWPWCCIWATSSLPKASARRPASSTAMVRGV